MGYNLVSILSNLDSYDAELVSFTGWADTTHSDLAKWGLS